MKMAFRTRWNESYNLLVTSEIKRRQNFIDIMRLFSSGISGKLIICQCCSEWLTLAALTAQIQYKGPSVEDIVGGACPGDFFDVNKARVFEIQRF